MKIILYLCSELKIINHFLLHFAFCLLHLIPKPKFHVPLMAISISALTSFCLFIWNWTRSKDNISLYNCSLRGSRSEKGVPSTLILKLSYYKKKKNPQKSAV